MANRYRVRQRVDEVNLVFFLFRHGDPLAVGRSEDEDDGEGAGLHEGKESFYSEGRKWEAAPAEKEMMFRAPPSRPSVSEKVTGKVSCCYWVQ